MRILFGGGRDSAVAAAAAASGCYCRDFIDLHRNFMMVFVVYFVFFLNFVQSSHGFVDLYIF